MKKNRGTAERIIRLIVAAIVAGLYANHVITGTWGIVLIVLAIIGVLTSLVSFCTLYLPFGINTCAHKRR